MSGWTVSLTTEPTTVFCELPPRPKILAVVPQPDDLAATGAEDHLQELKELLTAADLVYSDPERFKVVVDLPSFYAELENLQPDILYYYGSSNGYLPWSGQDHQGGHGLRTKPDGVLPP